jgi:hypothetical protein
MSEESVDGLLFSILVLDEGNEGRAESGGEVEGEERSASSVILWLTRLGREGLRFHPKGNASAEQKRSISSISWETTRDSE